MPAVQEMPVSVEKKADTAKLQDELTGALIGLARSMDDTTMISQNTWRIIIEGLFTTVTNVSFDNTAIENMIQKSQNRKKKDWFLTAATVRLLVAEQRNTICKNFGMTMKISVL